MIAFRFQHSCPSDVSVDWSDVIAREHARLPVATALPPVRVRVVENLDKLTAAEAKLAFLLRVEVEERLHVRGLLWRRITKAELARQKVHVSFRHWMWVFMEGW